MLKKTVKLTLLVALVLIIAIPIVVSLLIGRYAAAGVSKGATYALGVPTSVGGAHLGFSGVGLSGLNVANPAGFTSGQFLKLGSAEVGFALKELTADPLRVQKITLSDIDINLEKREGQSNYQVILDNLAKLQGKPGGSGASTPAPGGGGKKLVIGELVIQRVKVHADLIGAPGALDVINKAAKVNIDIDQIALQNVGQTGTGVGGTGVSTDELVSIITQAIFSAIANKGADILPLGMFKDITGSLGGLDGLKNIPTQILDGGAIKSLGSGLGSIGSGAGEAVKNVGGAVTEGVGGALKGLFGGDEKKDEKK